MNTIHNLGLPASECVKLVPARTAREQRAAPGDVVRAMASDENAATALAVRPRPANHLSGFARA